MFAKKRKKTLELSPDEIFLDSKNLPGFDRNQMEGRLVMLLSRRVALFVFLFFAIISFIMLGKLWNLQISHGATFRERAFFNSFDKHVLSPERGIIYDRNGEELAWNEARFKIVIDADKKDALEQIPDALRVQFFPKFSFDAFEKASDAPAVIIDDLSWESAERFIEAFPAVPFRIEASSARTYTDRSGFSHLLGYVGRSSDEPSSATKSGKTGVEKYYDLLLRGVDGVRLVETDAKNNIVSESLQQEAENGEALTLTIDADAQSKLYSAIGDVVEQYGFHGGAGVVVDVRTGEILAMTSYPEFNLNNFSHGISQEEFSRLNNDPHAPFFARVFNGTYIPGSIFKPIVALAALDKGIISPEKEIFSSGSISVPNPYFPDQPSIFRDWKAHGWVDMVRAIAVSSDVYFYTIGGGYGNQEGIGASAIERYAKLFGFGEPVFSGIDEARGMVPSPEHAEEWRIGDTYHFSIGQNNLQVTPIQVARFVSMLAEHGKVPDLHFVEEPDEARSVVTAYPLPDVVVLDEDFSIIQEGMALAAKPGGTAQALAGLGVDFGAKTGTAEIGNGRVNSWIMGYAPLNDPHVAMTVVLESGSETNLVGAASVSRTFMQWFIQHMPEYVK